MEVRPLRPDDGPRIVELFGPNGACGGCWCMFFRLRGPEFKAGKGAGNQAAFLELVARGQASGVLALEDGAPIGWCAVAPRREFARIEAGRSYRRDVPAGTWSLNCFFVARGWRSRGVARALLDGAVAHAFASGATEIEAYPVVPKAGTRPPAAFVYTGVASLFEAAGFAPVAEGSKTWVLRALPG